MLDKKFDKESEIREDENLTDEISDDMHAASDDDSEQADDIDNAGDEDDEVVLVEPGPHFPLAAGGATPLDLAKLGVAQFAYIRRALVNDIPMWTIHSASGDPLGAAHSFDQAWAAVKQNDLVPLRVH